MSIKKDGRRSTSTITNTTAQVAADPMLGLAISMGAGILAQEAQGQREVTRQTERLPTEGLAEEALTKLGFKVGSVDESDPIWRVVEFPAGWKLAPTEHSMWSSLLDEQGRKRASIFYKAAFYDRSAHGRFERRYVVTREFRDDEARYVAKDGATGKTIHEWPWGPCHPPEGAAAEEVSKFYAAQEKAGAEAAAWLLQKFPLAEDVTAYW